LPLIERTKGQQHGWFVYFWKLNPDKISDLVRDRKRLALRKLKERLSYEKEHIFFHCGNEQCPRCTFDEAVELAKEFGGEGSPSFINGVLGKIIKNCPK
jgi:transcription initiation factor TFIIE subunit alpha